MYGEHALPSSTALYRPSHTLQLANAPGQMPVRLRNSGKRFSTPRMKGEAYASPDCSLIRTRAEEKGSKFLAKHSYLHVERRMPTKVRKSYALCEDVTYKTVPRKND